MTRVSDERVRWTAQYRRDEEVGSMAAELLLARRVIEAVRRHAHYGCCVETWQDVAGAMREYDASQEGKP